jgi:hypothetical protein
VSDTKFKDHARNEKLMVEFNLMVENELNIIMNVLLGIKHDLYVLKFPRCQAKENNGGGDFASSAFGHYVYIIIQDKEMGDA